MGPKPQQHSAEESERQLLKTQQRLEEKGLMEKGPSKKEKEDIDCSKPTSALLQFEKLQRR